MKKKKKEKSIKKEQPVSPGGPPHGKTLRQCGRVLLISASYQICSLCMNPCPQDLPRGPGDRISLGAFSSPEAFYSQVSSILTNPAEAQIRGRCVGGCIGCTGCTGCTSCTGCTGSTGSAAPAYDPVAEAHNRGQALNEQGVAYDNAHNFAKALECFREAVRLWPENQVMQGNLRRAEMKVLNEEGVKYYKAKDWAKAVEYFQQALNKSPENMTVRNNLESAKNALENEIRQKEQQRKEAQAAESMRKSIMDMSSSFGAPAGSGPAPKASTPASGGLQFMSGAPGATTPPAANAQPPAVTPPVKLQGKKLEFMGNKAVEEARSNLESTKQGESGAVFDNKGKRVPGSSRSGVFAGTGSIEMSERARKDPRMIEAQKQFDDLQTKRQKLDEQRTQLAKERNSTKDPTKFQELTKQLDKAEKDFQANIQSLSNKTQEIEKLKRTIDTEVEEPAGQTGKGGAK